MNVSCLSLLCSLGCTCWEINDLLALWCVTFSCCCFFVTVPYGVSGQVWYIIASTPNNFLHFYFVHDKQLCKQIKYKVVISTVIIDGTVETPNG